MYDSFLVRCPQILLSRFPHTPGSQSLSVKTPMKTRQTNKQTNKHAMISSIVQSQMSYPAFRPTFVPFLCRRLHCASPGTVRRCWRRPRGRLRRTRQSNQPGRRILRRERSTIVCTITMFTTRWAARTIWRRRNARLNYATSASTASTVCEWSRTAPTDRVPARRRWRVAPCRTVGELQFSVQRLYCSLFPNLSASLRG